MFIFYMCANFFLIPEFDQTPCPFEWNHSNIYRGSRGSGDGGFELSRGTPTLTFERGLIRIKSIGCMQKQAVTGRFTRFTLSLNALTQSFMRLLKLHFGSMQVSFGMFNSA